jgi:hypothetical protein
VCVCVCVCVCCLLPLTFMCTRTARGSHSLHAHTARSHVSSHCTRFSNTVHYCTARSYTFTTHSPHIHHTFTDTPCGSRSLHTHDVAARSHTSIHTVRCSQTPNTTTHPRLAVTHSLALQTLSVPAVSLLHQADDPKLSCDPEPGLSCQVGVERIECTHAHVMGLWWGQARSQQTFSRSAEHNIRITCVQAAHVCVCVCVCVCVWARARGTENVRVVP